MRLIFAFLISVMVCIGTLANQLPAPEKYQVTKIGVPVTQTQTVEHKHGCSIERTPLALSEEITSSGDEQMVNLTALKPGVSYRLTCGVEADSNVKMKLSLSENPARMDHYTITLNDQKLSGSLNDGIEIYIQQGPNTVDMWYVKESNSVQTTPVYLLFLNNNPSEKVSVHSCSARSIFH